MQRKLDRFTNLSIVVLCLTVSTILIQKHFFPHDPQPPQAVAKGEILDLPESLTPGEAEVVVVAALAPGCGFCNESMGFYRALSTQRHLEGADLRLVAAVRDEADVEKEREKLQAEGVDVDLIVATDFKALRVPGTPTLILADRRGKVLGSWIGKLDENEQAEVFEALGLEGSALSQAAGFPRGLPNQSSVIASLVEESVLSSPAPSEP